MKIFERGRQRSHCVTIFSSKCDKVSAGPPCARLQISFLRAHSVVSSWFKRMVAKLGQITLPMPHSAPRYVRKFKIAFQLEEPLST